MKAVVIDEKNGKEVTMTIPEPSPDFFKFIGDFEMNDEQLRSRIDRMGVSADIKALLYSFSKATIRAGKVVLKIGRKIIDILFSISKAFPSLTFGVIFGLVVGALVAAIPLIGFVLGPLASSIAVAVGFVLGAKAELDSGDLGKRVDAVLAEFAPLRT